MSSEILETDLVRHYELKCPYLWQWWQTVSLAGHLSHIVNMISLSHDHVGVFSWLGPSPLGVL